MADGTFVIEVAGLSALTAALQEYPAISAPILQRGILESQAILAKNTNSSTVPIRTGFLVNHFQWVSEPLKGRWYPIASYARFVQFGTAPHLIEPKDRQALYWPGASHPVRVVHHPGSRANPYMDRIVAASQDEINDQFSAALKQIADAIAKTSI